MKSFIIFLVFSISLPLVYLKNERHSFALDLQKDTLYCPKNKTTLYFPLNSKKEKNNSLNEFNNRWYSSMLFAMEEPVLYKYKGDREIYRFLWLRTFHSPIAIRIEKKENNYTLYWKQCSGKGGYEPGKLDVNKRKEITKLQWEEWQKLLKDMNFLGMKTPGGGAFDGAQWIVEGIMPKKKYHIVDRWCPREKNYRQACIYLVSLTDLKIEDNDVY